MLGNDKTSKADISVIAKLHFIKIYIYTPLFMKVLTYSILSYLLVCRKKK